MKGDLWSWLPGSVLLLGLVLAFSGAQQQRPMPLRDALDTTVLRSVDGFQAQDIVISAEEQRVAGMDAYVMRTFSAASAAAVSSFSVYVGYYEQQTRGKTIHSPKNCLPGGGWEPLVSSRETIATPLGPVPVNRYLIQNGDQRALVLYWYQGRGRVAANEYAVKWHLLRDQALRGRSDEALVRIIVPVDGSEEEAFRFARRVARDLAVSVDRAVPA